MTRDEQMSLAKAIFEPEHKVLNVDRPEANLVVVIEDEFGKQDCLIPYGDMYDEMELRRSLESFKHNRETKTAEWSYQKKLSAEIVGYLNGEPDPRGRMGWLPKLVYKRFLDDFRLHFPALDKFVNDSQNADVEAVKQELQTIPRNWQKSDTTRATGGDPTTT